MKFIVLNKTKLIIVLACLNEEKYVDRAIKSILNQKMEDWILFCQDNNSQDDTYAIMTKYGQIDNRIKVRRLPTTVEAHESFNSAAEWALSNSISKFVTWFSGDDFFVEPDYFEKLIETSESLSNSNIIAAPKFLLESESNSQDSRIVSFDLDVPDVDLRLSQFINDWLNVCVLYAIYPRKIFIDILNSKNGKLSSYLGSDWWWCYSVVKNYQIKNVDVTFRKTQHQGGWRHSKNSLTSTGRSFRYFLFISQRPKFIYNHFFLQKHRFGIIGDRWIIIFLLKTSTTMLKEYFSGLLKLYKLLVRRLFFIKKKSH
jgi:glycosyltransferase involved in cell wall biosynthesis